MTEQQGARKERRRYWEEQIRRFGESGLTQVEYCLKSRMRQIRKSGSVRDHRQLTYG